MLRNAQKTGGYLWGLAGIMLAVGFIIHPPLTAAGMLKAVWVPDHAIILIALFALIFGLNLITFQTPDKLSFASWLGYIFLSLSAFLFIGIVYFELFLIPKLAVDLPELFDEGLRIGPLKVVLPITALLLVIGHVIYGIPLIRKKVLPAIPFIGLMIFSAPMAFKPVLPDLVATFGAVGYALFSVYFTLQNSRITFSK